LDINPNHQLGPSAGITYTLRQLLEGVKDAFGRRVWETVLGINIPIRDAGDHEFVLNAFTEPHRSRLKLKCRGRGLPKIYEYAHSGNLDNVFVISNKAFVNLTDENLSYELQGKLKGTLYSFDFSSTRP
jgi:hypothetical protein